MQRLLTNLAVLVFSIFAIEVGQVAVLVPPATMVCHCTVAERYVTVPVPGGEFPAIVISHGIP